MNKITRRLKSWSCNIPNPAEKENLSCRLRAWFYDPFGSKKEQEENRKIINQIVATRVMVRAATATAENDSYQKFPISHMIISERKKKRKD